MIEIYRKIDKEETLVASVPDDNATLERTLMGADEVTLSVTVSEPLDLRVGDYARLEGSSYTINRAPDLVKASAVEFRYDLVLESPLYNLLDKIYISDVQGLSRFSLSGTLNDFVELLLMNINRDDFDPGWTWATDKGDHPVTVVTERKNLSFDNTTCRDVLNRLADEFGVEYVVRDRTVAFYERVENATSLVFEQGRGKGLYTLQRQNVDADNTVTRAYVYGSTENLPVGYRKGLVERLCPRERDSDKYIPYFENREEYPKLVEREVYFDDVKPSFTGSVDTIGEDGLTLTCNAIDFSLKEVVIGKEGRVNFLSGDLTGKAFSFTCDGGLVRTLKLIPQEDEMAPAGNDGKRSMIPNATWRVQVGDKFTFTGITLPEAYVRTAEALLAEKGRKWMRAHSSLRVKYNLDVDYRYVREKGIVFNPGDVVGIVVPGMEMVQRLRLTSVKKQLYTGKLTCEVSNYLEVSLEDALTAKIQEVKSSIELDRSEVLNAVNATREWTTRNFGRLADEMTDGEAIVWDADGWQIKTVAQVPDAAKWDSRAFDDYMDQAVKTESDVVFKNLEVGTFMSGMIGGSGVRMDENGYAEMTGLTLREFLEVPELRFNRVDVVSGELWNSIAYGTVESVDTANRVVTLKLEEGELAGLHVNDICRGIFHNLTGNADGNRVDGCGFLTMAGFSTVYFTPTEIMENGKFRYELKPGTSVHPCPAMKFAVYGNFTDKTRRASAYSTRTYKRYLTGVATWEVDHERNIAMQFGDLSGLHVGGVSMEGYSAYLNNIYMKGHLEFTDGQREELKGENGYTVLLTTYDAVVAVDSEGKIDSSLYDIVNVVDGKELVKAGNDTVVASRFKIQTQIQAYKAGALTYAETPGEGEYAVALTAKGCEYVFADGVLTITKIMVDKATVEIEVNCEGREVFLKLFTLTRLYGGSDAVYMDLTNENASVTCNTEGVVTGSIPGSTAKVYVGTTLDGAWSFSGSFSGCTGSVNASTGAITVTGLTADSGSVTVTATKKGYASLTAVYSLSKAYPGPNGEPAVVYSVRPSADVIVKDKTGTFTPASISCEKLKQIGNSAPYVTTEKTLKYQLSDGSLTDYTGAVSVGSATWIEFTLYEGSTVLDRERVPVIADGKDGIDANLLDWIEEWNGNKTDVGRELIISPRMVAGKKESSGKFTGVMFGRDMIEVNGVMQTGLFGMKNGDLTFSIDAQTGDAFFGGTVLVRKDAKNYVTMNYKDTDDWGLKGVIDGNEDKPVFQLGSVNKIGNFNITNSCIGKSTDRDNPTAGMSLYEEFIKFKEANRLSMIGSNVYPLSTGLKGVARFINKDYNRTLTNYGVEIDVSGANENIAIDILNGDVKLGNGVVKGGRYVLKYTSSLSGYQIGDDDEYIVCTNSSKVDLKLPATPKQGKTIWVKQLGSGMVGIIPQGNHKMYYRGSNYNWGLINDKSGGVTVLAMITFIGNVNGANCWVMNTMDVAGIKFGDD
ncbi:hypothetical protein CE91St24_23890 [Odoribacteraceae bacterium]|uniref:hypothetical protein n=1 Tax=Butyricimonas TaxID=574697 RepID=UPI002082F518|nr:hypothetical protein [Butyricimonas paravirosa]BDF52678.1 hypothetical protein CE91St21_01130 [Odoribacteraceae bacterium]GKH91617.1 hypothetical protein CE91St23_01130 [Odoribacteraceae bacterium]GKH96235.1 hypothetical protein CE91St22_01130 [Odoribacteraceae bacterium]GKI03114.1 hypothetical protein CE91St24_23890 [Odoribacteraceae bacterium]